MSKSKVCNTLGVCRSSIYWKSSSAKRSRYQKAEDNNVLEDINKVIQQRPTYGYKRLTAMVNKQRMKNALALLNRKRIYRVMDMNGLLLKKTPAIRSHEPTGQIITLHSNTR